MTFLHNGVEDGIDGVAQGGKMLGPTVNFTEVMSHLGQEWGQIQLVALSKEVKRVQECTHWRSIGECLMVMFLVILVQDFFFPGWTLSKSPKLLSAWCLA